MPTALLKTGLSIVDVTIHLIMKISEKFLSGHPEDTASDSLQIFLKRATDSFYQKAAFIGIFKDLGSVFLPPNSSMMD